MEPSGTEEIFDWQPVDPNKDTFYLDAKAKGSPTLCVLVFSCLFGKAAQLYRMKNYIQKNPRFIDYAIFLGNLSNLSSEEKKAAEVQAQTEGEISSVLDYAENLGCKVLYVPAEGDPDSLYEPTEEQRPKLTTNSKNIHKTCYSLGEGLIVAGIGGYFNNNTKSWNEINLLEEKGNYTSSKYFETNLRSLIQNANMTHEKSQILLASYISPPLHNEELQDNEFKDYISVIKEAQASEKVLAILSGNKNRTKSLRYCSEITVLNPGSLKDGHMAILELIKVKGKWKIASTEFINLM